MTREKIRMLHAEPFQFAPRRFLQGSFSKDDGDDNEKVKKQ